MLSSPQPGGCASIAGFPAELNGLIIWQPKSSYSREKRRLAAATAPSKLKLERRRCFAQACSQMGGNEPKKILMVDDDVALLRIVREALTTCLRCEVDTSPNPEYAFELALKKTYDLLIFDFSMPMIDGAMLFFLIGKVYDNASPPRIVPPLLLISGQADESRAQELLKEPGVRGLVAKPFSMNRLMEKAKECVPGMQSRS
jgi:CheY-like chemotaxis protein